MRACIVGDSIVNGAGDSEALGWVGRFMRPHMKRNPDLRSYNLGIVRDTSADILQRWEAEASRRFVADQPSRLAFSFGANDCVTQGAGCRVPLPQALENAEAILLRGAALAPTLMIGPIPVLDDPEIDARISVLSAGLRQLCQRIGAPYLPIFDFVRRCEVWTREAAAGDGTHPGAGGYQALADFISDWPAARRWIGV